MRYLLAIYVNEAEEARRPEGVVRAALEQWFAYSAELSGSGKMLAGDALQPVATAASVRLGSDGASVVTDGPFAETKEQLGGYYLVDVADRAEAVQWAAKMPHLAHGGSVEIRPIMEFGE